MRARWAGTGSAGARRSPTPSATATPRTPCACSAACRPRSPPRWSAAAGAGRRTPSRCGARRRPNTLSAHDVRRLPLLRRPARGGLRRPRDVAAGQLIRAARPRERDGAVLSPSGARLRAVPARAARGVSERRGDLLRLRVLLVVLVDVARALAPLRRADDREVGPRRRKP